MFVECPMRVKFCEREYTAQRYEAETFYKSVVKYSYELIVWECGIVFAVVSVILDLLRTFIIYKFLLP